jgi:hypothetical protein
MEIDQIELINRSKNIEKKCHRKKWIVSEADAYNFLTYKRGMNLKADEICIHICKCITYPCCVNDGFNLIEGVRRHKQR